MKVWNADLMGQINELMNQALAKELNEISMNLKEAHPADEQPKGF
jgi:hypothetical protein